MISEDDPVVSLALCGIRPALVSALTGVPPNLVSVRLTAARKAGFAISDFTAYRGEKPSPDELARTERRMEARETAFPDRVRAFDPHPDCPGVLISDQVGDTLMPGLCTWCGDRILAGTRVRRLEREVGGQRQVTRFCAACCVAMAARGNANIPAHKHGSSDIQERWRMGKP